jgi:NAD(P)H-quinone oxidoreductase subunit 4
MELLPRAHSRFSPCLVMVGVIQILYGASTSLGQRN